MSISLWQAEQLGKENFALGAASRDAEVATANESFTQQHRINAELCAEISTLRDKVKVLRVAILRRMASENSWPEYIQEAMDATEPTK